MAEKLIRRIDIPMTRDERGFVCFPLNDEFLSCGGYYNVHCPSLNPGMVRGNHYHPENEEYVFILGKNCRVVAEDQATKTREEWYFNQQPHNVLVFPANVAHAIRNEGKDVLYLICFNKQEDGGKGRPQTKRANILK